MRLTDHLTDVQLNEYLDNETIPEERIRIESHVSMCDQCAARLTDLQALFTEIESIPEVALSRPFAARFTRPVGRPAPLPRFLTLTATLQAAMALLILTLAAPRLTNLVPDVETPSLTGTMLQLQRQWITWSDLLSSFQLPTLPQLPALEISSFMLTLTLVGLSMLWLLGNGLLLRKQMK
jgi:anti-sigma factor RsiW